MIDSVLVVDDVDDHSTLHISHTVWWAHEIPQPSRFSQELVPEVLWVPKVSPANNAAAGMLK